MTKRTFCQYCSFLLLFTMVLSTRSEQPLRFEALDTNRWQAEVGSGQIQVSGEALQLIPETFDPWRLEFISPSSGHQVEPIRDPEGVAREIWLNQLWEGIDLRVYTKPDGQPGYDVIVHPGASPDRYQFIVTGATDLRLNTNGDLVSGDNGRILMRRPFTYQLIDERQVEVASRFSLHGHQVGFEVAAYDASQVLVIDPTLPVDGACSVQDRFNKPIFLEVYEDRFGNVALYEAGMISDDPIHLPTPGVLYPNSFASENSYIHVWDEDLNLTYNSYWPSDQVRGFDVNDDAIHIIGKIIDGVTPPITAGAWQTNAPSLDPSKTFFYSRVSHDLATLQYSTYVGPTSVLSGITGGMVIIPRFEIHGMTVDDAGNTYIIALVGNVFMETTSGAFQETYDPNVSPVLGWLGILDSSGNLVYGTYLSNISSDPDPPSPGNVVPTSIDIGPSGEIYVGGVVAGLPMPTTDDALYNFDDIDILPNAAFLYEFAPVASLGSGSNDLVYGTGISGGTVENNAVLLKAGPNGQLAYQIHFTQVGFEPTFPLAGEPEPWDPAAGGSTWLATFDMDQKSLEAMTYVNGIEMMNDLEFGLCGDLYATYSRIPDFNPNADLPRATADGFEQTVDAVENGMLHHYDAGLTELEQGTFIQTGPGGVPLVLPSVEMHPSNPWLYMLYNSFTFLSPNNHECVTGVDTGSRHLLTWLAPLQLEDKIYICPNSTVDPVLPCNLGAASYSYSWVPLTVSGNMPTGWFMSGGNTQTPTFASNGTGPECVTMLLTVSSGSDVLQIDQVEICTADTNFDVAGPDKYICQGDSVTLGNLPVEGYNYSWTPSGTLDDPNAAMPVATPSVTTTYTVNYIDCNGSPQSDSVTVYVEQNLAGVVDAGPNHILCPGEELHLGIGELGSVIYQWEPANLLSNPNSPSPVVENLTVSPQVFTLTVISLCDGSTASDTAQVTLSTAAANAGPDELICRDTPTQIGLAPNPNVNTYSWSFIDDPQGGTMTGANTAQPTIDMPTPGNYEILLVTESDDCGITEDIMEVNVLPVPVPNAGPDKLVCADLDNPPNWLPATIGTPTIPLTTYSWSPTTYLNDPTVAQPTVQLPPGFTNSITYTLTLTDTCFGQQYQDSVVVTPSCEYPWIDAYESSEFYNDCDNGVAPDTVAGDNQFPIPCYYKIIGMVPRQNVEYWWTPTTWLEPYFAITNTIDYPIVVTRAQAQITYTLHARDLCSGKISTDTVTVWPDCGGPGWNGIDPPTWPVCDAGEEFIDMCNEDTQIIGTPGDTNLYSYSWFPTNFLSDPGVPQPQIINPTHGLTYTIEVTDSNNFVCVDSITVYVHPSPLAHAGDPVMANCGGDVIGHQLGPPIGATQYENPNWVHSWSPPTGLSDPTALRPIIIGPVAPVYTVTVTDPNTDCESEAFVTITLGNTFADAGPGGTICPGQSIQIGTPDPNDGSSYSWSWSPSTGLDNPAAAQPNASPDVTTIYVLAMTRDPGTASACTDYSSVTVTVTQTSTLIADAGDDVLHLCTSDPSFTIGGNANEPGATYLWTSVPAGGVAALSSTTVAQPTVNPATLTPGTTYTFTLTVTDTGTGCTSSDDVVIMMENTTPPTLTVNPTTINSCIGSSEQLSGISVSPFGVDYTIAWSSSSGHLSQLSNTSILNPSVNVVAGTMNFTVTVTNPCGGSDSANVTVIGNQLPTVTMPAGSTVCSGASVSLTPTVSGGTPPYTYLWEPSGLVLPANTLSTTATPDLPTTFSLTVTDANGCQVVGTVFIDVSNEPPELGEDITECQGTPVTIGVPAQPGYTYLWSPGGQTTSQITVTPTMPTTYTLTATLPGCAPLSDTITVTPLNPPVTANAGADDIICPGDCTIIGSPAVPGITYTWSPPIGLNNPFIATPNACPDQTITYTVTAENCAGATAQDTVTITVQPAPPADAGPDLTACEFDFPEIGDPYANPSFSYEWNPKAGLLTPFAPSTLVQAPAGLVAPATLTYTLTVTDPGLSCTAEDSVQVTFYPVPELDYPGSVDICIGDSVVLGDGASISGISPPYSVLWTPNLYIDDPTLENPTVNPPTSMVYTVTVVGQGGCSAQRVVQVNVVDDTIYASATPACPGETTTLSATDIAGATYAWTGPNGYSAVGRVQTFTTTANSYGTYTVTVTTIDGCELTDTVELYDPCSCDLQLSLVSVGPCVWDGVSSQSTADVTIQVSWGAGSPSGETIEISVGAAYATIDTTTQTSPQQVTLTASAHGGTNLVIANFTPTISCLQLLGYNTPGPCAPSTCSITGVYASTACDDNGTSDGGDDTFNVSIIVLPANAGTYDVSGDLTVNGLLYGRPQLIATGLSIPSAPLSITLTDSVDTNCFTNLVITPPANPCSITCAPPLIVCAPDTNVACNASTNPVDTGFAVASNAPDNILESLAVSCFVVGPHDAEVTAGVDFTNKDALVMFPVSAEGAPDPDYIPPTMLARHADIGTVWGLAYRQDTAAIYAAAYLKRGTDFGPGGPGAIYRIDSSLPVGSNVVVYATVPNAGADPHDFVTHDYQSLQYDEDTNNDVVGKRSLGDLELSPDGTTLYVVNLNDRHLYAIPAGVAAPAPVVDVGAIPIPAGCNNDDFRPMGLGFHSDGILYIGAVCGNESQTSPDGLSGYAIAYDPVAGTFTEVLSFPIDWEFTTGNFWQVWHRFDTIVQPIISDVDFVDGDMLLGIHGRNYDMAYSPSMAGLSRGDLVRACWNTTSNAWVLESGGVCDGVTGSGPALGPGGGSFYDDTDGVGVVSASIGAIAVLPDNTVVGTLNDPVRALSAGVYHYGSTGQLVQAYEVYQGSANIGLYGKTGGLGDLEYIPGCPPGEPVITFADTASSSNCAGTGIERVWTASNLHGSVTCTQIIALVDPNAPVITCPADANVACEADTSTNALGVATATDTCDGNPAITYADQTNSGSCAHSYTILRVWTATDACGNAASCTQTITVADSTPPSITCPSDLTITGATGTCQATIPALSPSATDNCSSAGQITVVQNPAAGTTVTGPTNIQVVFTATDDCGNSAMCTATVTVACPPCEIVSVTPTLNCDNQGTGFPTDDTYTLTLTVTGVNTGSGYNVSGDLTGGPFTYGIPQTISTTLATGTTYNITITDVASGGCSTSISVTTMGPCSSCTLGGTLAANDPLCDGDTLMLYATGTPAGAYTYSWTGPGGWASSAQNPTRTNAPAGTYQVTIDDGSGCTIQLSTNIIVNSNPTFSLADASVCAGETVTRSGPAGMTAYAWTGPGGFTSGNQSITVSTAGNYSLTVTDSNGCQGSDSFTLTVHPNPSFTPVGDSACEGSALMIAASGVSNGDQMRWRRQPTGTWSAWDNNFTQTVTGSAMLSDAGTYDIQVRNSSTGCISSNTAVLTVHPTPTFTPVGSTNCAGATMTISITNTTNVNEMRYRHDAGTFSSWQSPGTKTVTDGVGVYHIEVRSTAGCVAADTVNVATNSGPSFTLDDATVCAGTSVTRSGPAGMSTYAWTGPGGFTSGNQSITVSAAGTYTLTVTDSNGCQGSDSFLLTVNSNPSFTLDDATVCAGTSVTRSGPAGMSTYAWTGPGGFTSGNQSITVSAAGTYTLTVTDSNGCQGSDSFLLTVNSNPSFTLDDATVCAGTSVTRSGPAGMSTYAWTGPGGFTSGNQSITVSAAGTYTLTVTDSNGCQGSDSFLLTVNSNPSFTLDDATVCAGTSVTRSGPAGMSTYAWTGPGGFTSGNQSITVSAAGTYTLTVTDSNGCQGSDSFLLTVNSNPSFTLDDATVCAGTSVTRSGPAGMSTYAWTGPGGFTSGNQSITVSAAGTYTLTVTDSNGCQGSDSFLLTVNSNPSFTLDDATVCAGTSVTRSGPAGMSTYAWTGPGGFTSGNQSITVSAAGTYTLTVTDSNGCQGSDSFLLTVNSNPSFTLDDATVCAGTSVTRSGPAGMSTYAWTGPGGFTSGNQSITVSAAGTYTLTVTDSNGCQGSDSFLLTVNSNPSFTLDDATVCVGTSVTRSGPAGMSTYAWTGPGGFTSGNQSITVSAAGTYTLTVTDSNGCQGSDSFTLTTNALPGFSLADAEVCTGGSATRSGPSNMTTYAWTGPGGFMASSQQITVNAAGTYTLTVTDTNGCQASDSFLLTVHGNPSFTLNDQQICPGGSAMASGPANMATYAWTGPNLFSSSDQTITVTNVGTYTLTVTDTNGCQATESFDLSLYAGLDLNLPDLETCENGSVTFSGPANMATYSWSGPCVTAPSNTQNYTINPVNASCQGTYSLTVTDTNGCTATDSFTLTVTANPTIDLDDAETCSGDSVVRSGPANMNSYSWSGPSSFSASSQSITVSVAGVYSLQAVDAGGCTSTGSFTLVVNANPTLVLDDASICQGSTVVRSGPNDMASYAWSGPAGFAANSQSITVSVAGAYSLTITDTNGCQATDSFTLTVHANPSFTLADATVCEGSSITRSGPAGMAMYAWTGPGGFTSANQSITVTNGGSYSLTVTDTNGCTGSDSFLFTVNNNPVVDLADAQICSGSTVIRSGPAGMTSYTWSGPGGFSANSQSITASVAGVYCLDVVDANGCTDSNCFTLTVADSLSVPLTDAEICQGDSVTRSGPSNMATYAWTGPGGFSSSSQSITVNVPGIYTLEVTDSAGCSGSNSFTLTVHPNPTVVLNDATVCEGNSITRSGPAGMAMYAWTGPGGFTSANQSITVTNGGSYSLTVTDTNGCTGSDSFLFTVNNNPVVDLADAQICSGSTVIRSGPAGMTSYTWSGPGGFSANSQSITASVAGVYCLDVVDANGCTDSNCFTLTVADSLSVPLTDAEICQGDSVTRSGPSNMATYAWTGPGGFSSSSQSITVNVPGIYTLEVTDSAGCSGSNSFTLTVHPNPTVVLNDATVCEGNSITRSGPAGMAMYAWTGPGGFTSANQSITVTNGGSYSLTVTDTNGCTGSDSFLFTVNNNPMVDLADAQICSGSTVIRSGPAGMTSYTWSGPGGFSASSQSITAGVAGVYCLDVVDANGCTDSNCFTLTVADSLSVPLTDAEICQGNSVTRSGPSNMATYAWTGPGGFSSSSQSITVNVPGIYTLQVTDSAGCSGSNSFTLTVHANPSFTLNDVTVCEGNSITRSGPAGMAMYAWTGPGGFTSANQSITVTNGGSYSLTVTDTNGCTGSDSFLFTVNNNPMVDLADAQICSGSTVIRSGPAGMTTYAWSGPGGFSASSQSITASVAGVYCLDVVDANGCTDSNCFTLTLDPCVTCGVEIVSTPVTPCFWNGSASIATLTVNVAWSNAPSGEDINVVVGGVTQTIVVLNSNGSEAVQYVVASDAASHPVDAGFVGGTCIAPTANYTAPPPCAPGCNLVISDIAPDDCQYVAGQSLYDVTVTVLWANGPAGEDIEVVLGGVTQIVTVADPSSGSNTTTFTGLVADGSPAIPVTATFENGTCTAPAGQYNAPPPCPPCDLQIANVIVGPCVYDGFSQVTVEVHTVWSNATPGDSIDIVAGGLTTTFTSVSANGTGTSIYTLIADGSSIDIDAAFLTDTNCRAATISTNLPNACDPSCPPVVIMCPSNVTLECGASTDPVDTGTPTGMVSYVDTVTTGACPQNLTIERVWTETNFCGNADSCTQIITVVDTTPPTITGVPADTNVSCDVGIPGYSVGASDNCSTPNLSFSATTNGTCPVVIIRTWTATDDCGNSAAATQMVTIADTVPPAFACPNSFAITGAIATCLTAIPDLRPTASDNCDTSVIAVSQSPAPGTVVSGPTNVSVIITATDACGNEAACTTTVTVVCPECLITDVSPAVNCNGQGTGSVADDTFSVSVIVTADNGTTFSVSGDATVTGLAYGVQHTI